MKVRLGRRALRKVVAERIEFRPTERRDARGYRLRWSLVTSTLMDGHIEMASPRGLAPYITRIALPCEAWLRAA